MAATPMTGGEALVRSLYQEGVRVVFGLPGVQLYGVMAALRDEPRIRFVNTRHEQGAGFMADGYARASGTPGVVVVTSGPAATNTLTPLAESYAGSVPVFAIGGIDETNLPQLIALGLRRVCVIRAVADAPDPESATRRLRAMLDDS